MTPAPGTFVLYGRPGCHLCDEARAALRRAGVRFVEIDITTDDALHAAYLERIPVVTLDGRELFEFFVDESRLAVLAVTVGGDAPERGHSPADRSPGGPQRRR